MRVQELVEAVAVAKAKPGDLAFEAIKSKLIDYLKTLKSTMKDAIPAALKTVDSAIQQALTADNIDLLKGSIQDKLATALHQLGQDAGEAAVAQTRFSARQLFDKTILLNRAERQRTRQDQAKLMGGDVAGVMNDIKADREGLKATHGEARRRTKKVLKYLQAMPPNAFLNQRRF